MLQTEHAQGMPRISWEYHCRASEDPKDNSSTGLCCPHRSQTLGFDLWSYHLRHRDVASSGNSIFLIHQNGNCWTNIKQHVVFATFLSKTFFPWSLLPFLPSSLFLFIFLYCLLFCFFLFLSSFLSILSSSDEYFLTSKEIIYDLPFCPSCCA